MPKYFFHLHDHVDKILDPEGVELGDFEAVVAAALRNARDLISGDARDGMINLNCRIDVEDASGAVVHTLPFEDAVSIQRGSLQHK